MHALLHALTDTLKITPFLFFAFLLIAVLSKRVGNEKYARLLSGRFAPLLGAATGVIPQCGFSVMAAKLFQERCITVGTLLAVFVSTSDEAAVILATNGRWVELLTVLLLKLVLGVLVGYMGDLIFHSLKTDSHTHAEEGGGCCSHAEGESRLHAYLWHPLKHCVTAACYVFIVNAAFGLLVEWVGEDSIAAFLSDTEFLQPLISALIGLIPNCASSVVLAEAYVAGGLSFGAMFAGLVSNAGVGLAVLLKDRKNIKLNVLIILTLYLVGATVGEIVTAITYFI